MSILRSDIPPTLHVILQGSGFVSTLMWVGIGCDFFSRQNENQHSELLIVSVG